MEPEPQFRNPGTGALQGQSQYQLSQQQTMPQPIVTMPLTPVNTNLIPAATQPITRKLSRIFAIILTLVLAVAIFFIWHSPSVTGTTSGITQQNSNGASTSADDNNPNSTSVSGDIQVYVVGAVKHPGVYTLPADARLFQLLQAAGGALPNANLVALNLATKLTDGEEVYVLAIGEIPPTYVLGDAPLNAILHLHKPVHDRTYSLVGPFLALT